MVWACFKTEQHRLQKGNSQHETLRKILKNKSEIKMGTGQERCQAEGRWKNTEEIGQEELWENRDTDEEAWLPDDSHKTGHVKERRRN